MTEVLPVAVLGVLDKIDDGAQGIVYRVPGIRIQGRPAVYKKYKPGAIPTLDLAALAAMPEFLTSMSGNDGTTLLNIAAWPCQIVQDKGNISGFVMPEIPDRFFTDFWTSKPAPSKVMAGFQHLLNPDAVLAKRFKSAAITERQRYELLLATVISLGFLHEHRICVGDMSPKNLLFSLTGQPAVYFIDCDAMRVKGVSATIQMDTPDWFVPSGEEKATPHSDRYKLGLLALRLLVGDQQIKDPTQLPPEVPSTVRQLITDTLQSTPDRRPPLTAWKLILKQAATSASTKPRPSPRPKTGPAKKASVPAPVPVAAPMPVATPQARTAAHLPPGGATYTPPIQTGKWPTAAVVPVAALIAVVAGIIVANVFASSNSTPNSARTTAPSSPSEYGEPTQAYAPAETYAPTQTYTTTQTTPAIDENSSIPVDGADQYGFISYPGARCRQSDPAVFIGRTDESLFSVCQTGAGTLYYRGYAQQSGLSLEIDGATIVVANEILFTNNGYNYFIFGNGRFVIEDQNRSPLESTQVVQGWTKYPVSQWEKYLRQG